MVDFDYTPISPTSGSDYKPSGELPVTLPEPDSVEPQPQQAASLPPLEPDESVDASKSGGEESEPLLTFEEGRVLGCLIEKAKTVPDSYPLSLNSLTLGCNQKTSRLPVTELEESEVMEAIEGLRTKRLVHRVDQAGARTPKFQHRAESTLGVEEEEAALLGILLLRGPQTTGELRTRSERLYRFESPEEVDEVLGGLVGRDEPLVKLIPPSHGRKEPRYHQLLGEYPLELPDRGSALPTAFKGTPRVSTERFDELEERVFSLEEKLNRLSMEFEQLRELWD